MRVAFDFIMIDEKYRMVVWHLPVLGHDHAAVVKHEPTTIEPRSDNGVIFLPDVVAQDDDPKVVSGNSCFLQGNELCDRVIFAVSSAYRECGQRRTPDILLPVNC